jgi:hypothetical protein
VAVASLVAALVSAVAAAFAVWFASMSAASAARSATASQQSAATSQELLALETGRRKGELTPRLSVSLRLVSRDLQLGVRLDGPPGLERLDDVVLELLEFDEFRFLRGDWEVTDSTLTQLMGQVWAPYCFAPGPCVYRGCREWRIGPVLAGDAAECVLEATSPPPFLGIGAEDWRRACGTRLWLRLKCELAEWGPWVRICEIDTATEPAIVEVP